MSALTTFLRAGLARIRGEAGWVAAQKVVEFALQFGALKVLTSLLGPARFGEFGVFIGVAPLVQAFAFAPMDRAYERHFHTAYAQGQARSAAAHLLRWYGVASGVVLAAGLLGSSLIASRFGLPTWGAAAAAAYVVAFAFGNILRRVWILRREHRMVALLNIPKGVLPLMLCLLAFWLWQRGSTVALLASALGEALVAAVMLLLFLRDLPAPGPSAGPTIQRLLRTMGLPMIGVVVIEWLLAASDRYAIAAHLDLQSTGVFLAVAQVSAAPFALLHTMMDSYLTPIAYARAGDLSDPARTAEADRIVLRGIGAYVGLGLAGVGLFALVGPWLVASLTSSDYVLPGALIAAIAGARFLMRLGLLCRIVFLLHDRVRRLVAFQLVGAAVAVPSLWIGAERWGVPGVAAALLLTSCCYLSATLLGPGGVRAIVLETRREAAERAAMPPLDDGPQRQSAG